MSTAKDDPQNLDPHDFEARVDEVFDRALDVPRTERSVFLDQACAQDPALRARVERLLAFSDDPPSLLEQAPSLHLQAGEELLVVQEPSTPAQLGSYRILEEIGRGGMGVVYLGVRADGHFEQKVAVKVMQTGTGSPEARHRFEQERQIIASLRHANIAHLYDGGVTEDGRPYSAMELVEGQPIHLYCDQQGLGIDQRLRLMEVVARAVHHAHQSLVVHCDLKPSNILVTAQGEIKLLDFGVAKLLESTGREQSSMVRYGTRAVTPLYASPEQLRGEAVTTASDIYQLGLLLFELLTGQRAREVATAPSGSARDESADPSMAPSKAVRQATEERVTTAATKRGLRPRELLQCLRGDLDRIVLAAMHRQPEQRYRSAAELAEELKRYRYHEPLTVRPGTLTYRGSLFVRRNRLAAVVAAVLVLLLIGYSITVTLQAQRIARERDRAQRIQAFALGLYGAGDPYEGLGPELSAADLVSRGVERANAELAEEPEVQAEVKQYLAEMYLKLGLFEEAESQLREALRLFLQAHGEAHLRTASVQRALGRVLLERDAPEALALLEQALKQHRRFLGDEHPDTARVLHYLGLVLRSQARYAEAEQHLREGLHILRRDEVLRIYLADALTSLAWVVRIQGRPEEAEGMLREALEVLQRQYGESHPRVANVWNDLATVLWQVERWQEGEEAIRTSIEIKRHSYGDQHPGFANSLGNLAGALARQGELQRAAELYGQVLEMRSTSLGARHPRVAQSTAQLAEVLHKLDRFEEAETLFERALDIFGEHLPADHPSFARVWRGLGALHIDAGQLDLARRALDRARPIYAGIAGSTWSWRVDVMLAEVERKQGRLLEARNLLDQAEGKIGTDPLWMQRWQREMLQLAEN